jgi:Cu2+-exporting ATPase
MSLSSFFVVTNALRLNLVKIHDAYKDKPVKNAVTTEILQNTNVGQAIIENSNTERKETEMTKTMNIEGMMCGHCEMTVKNALEAVEGVESAVVSHENGTAVVTLSGDVSDDALKSAVEAKDYKVTGIA